MSFENTQVEMAQGNAKLKHNSFKFVIAFAAFVIFVIVSVTFCVFHDFSGFGEESSLLPTAQYLKLNGISAPDSSNGVDLTIDDVFFWNWRCWSQWLNVSFNQLPDSKDKCRDIPFFVREQVSTSKGVKDVRGEDVFERHTVQREGWFPRTISQIEGYSDSQLIQLYETWGLWLIEDSDPFGKACKPIPSKWLIEEKFKPVSKSTVHIRVLGYNRHKSIARLLDSLNAADYGKDKVNIHVSIDEGSEGQQSLKIAQQFKWKHGEKTVLQRKERGHIVGQWTNAWEGIPNSREDVLVVFEDDLVVSKYWYQFLKRALKKYRSESFDPRAMGIGLEVPSTVIGETRTYRCCGKRKPSIALKESEALMYKYQLPGTWGTALFPEHWTEFVKWYQQNEPDLSYQPCVHNFRTNDWWQNKPDSIFSAWIARFVYEQGWYMLYPHMPGNHGFASSHRDTGEHVNRTREWGASSRLVEKFDTKWFDKKLASEQVESLQLFDFHLNNVTAAPNTLKFRRLLFPDVTKKIRRYSKNVEYLTHKCFRYSQIPQPILEE
jgi:hypothetical protein